LFIKSSDDAKTFSKPKVLSNHKGFTDLPQLVTDGANNLYVVWQDNSTGNFEIFFRKSVDGGNTFGKTINLSNDAGESIYPEITSSGSNLYVIWFERHGTESSSDRVVLRVSADEGTTFNTSRILSDIPIYGSEEILSHPKISAVGTDVYAVWEVTGSNEGKTNGLFFIKSSDYGSTFDKIVKFSAITDPGEPEISASKNTLYIAWDG